MKLYVSGGMTFVAVLWMAATPPAVRAQDPAVCDALSTADRDGQVQIVESTPSCASTLVGLLVADPASRYRSLPESIPVRGLEHHPALTEFLISRKKK